MPPERRVNALTSPRSPLLPSLPHHPQHPLFNSVEGSSSPDSYPTSYHQDRQHSASPTRRGHHRRLSKQQQLRNELQLRHEKSMQQQDQLRTAYLEFHRQRVEYQQQRQPDPRTQSRHSHHHPHHRRTLTSRVETDSTRTSSATTTATPVASLQLHPSSTFPSFISASAPPTRHPSPHIFPPPHRTTRIASPRPLTPPPSRTNQYSDWATVRERERARLLSHLNSFRETLGATVMAPPPRARHLARENLQQLAERIKRRRARARETILYDLHQGVKSVEAQVHKQVEMVLSRLKEAPGSRYAFALTHSFLSQIPALTYGGRSEGEGETTSVQNEEDNGQSEDQMKEDQQQQQQQQHADLEASFDAVALGCDSGGAQKDGQRQLTISSSGASEVLSACLNTSYTTACSQVLNAALPSFIPSMVAPLVCVFSYPAPSTTAPRSESKGFVYPWGLPGDGHPNKSATAPSSLSPAETTPLDATATNHPEERQGSPHGTPDPGIVVLHKKSWTQAEREALYLAATRFRLQGQWSKIREMMNLHRTDKEIEAEYKKLYCPREDGALEEDDDDDSDVLEEMDEHDDEESEPVQGMQSSDSGMDEDQDSATTTTATTRPNYRRRRAATTDGEADDEAETEPIVFMKFGGTHARRSQVQMQNQLYQYRQSQYPALDRTGSPCQNMTMAARQQAYGNNSPPARDGASPFQSNLSLHPIPSLDSSPVVSRPMTPHEQQQQPHGQTELTMDPRQRPAVTEPPIRIFKSEFMIDKRFVLEEIPMHI
ncbi:hypothetical protein EMPS_08421 [Entomortierella parvispora]|uniref:Myb-like domain-containing protein n=1 Tax=Entomortierella parvispora TaxID=205924 RepID=A0A9P3HG76_9FUNG|nr:hypothetical protein EMPS_08421 [Entomortierella parvispora]